MINKKICATYKELQDNANKNNFSIYGDLDEYNNKFELIHSPNQNYTFGIMYYDCGIEPQILLSDDGSKLLVGFEKRVLGLDCNTKTEQFQIKLVSPFYEFIKTESCILAICELDIYAFDFEHQVIWSANLPDVIENYDVSDKKNISVSCANGVSLILSLKDGKAV